MFAPPPASSGGRVQEAAGEVAVSEENADFGEGAGARVTVGQGARSSLSPAAGFEHQLVVEGFRTHDPTVSSGRDKDLQSH